MSKWPMCGDAASADTVGVSCSLTAVPQMRTLGTENGHIRRHVQLDTSLCS